MEIDFTSVDDHVNSFDNETLEPDLDKFTSELGLGTAIADKFAKNNSVKTSINNDKIESDSIKTQQTYQVATSRENLYKQSKA